MSVLGLREVGLNSESNSASIHVKIIGGHPAKNISPKCGCGRPLKLVGLDERKLLPDDPL